MAEGDMAQPTGLVVVGRFKGIKASAPYTIGDRSGMSAPKLGVEDADGNVFRITASDETAAEYAKKPRGSVVAVPVIARAFIDNGRAQVRLSDRTVGGDGGGENWQ